MTDKKEAENCWDFLDCKVKESCPAYVTDSGQECWLVAGSYNRDPFCPKVVRKIINCWECDWYKKVNPEK